MQRFPRCSLSGRSAEATSVRKLLNIGRSLVISFGMVIIEASAGSACVCAEPRQGTPPGTVVAERVALAPAAFEASVLTDANSEGRTETRVRVIRVWKGDVPSRLTIMQEGGDCQFPFAEGETYLVYTREGSSRFTTDLCSGTNDRRGALVDLRFLGPRYPPTRSILGFRASWLSAGVSVLVLVGSLFTVLLIRRARTSHREIT